MAKENTFFRWSVAMNSLLAIKKQLYPAYLSLHYFLVRQKLKLKKVFFRKKSPTYLFILSLPFSGSTVLHELLSTSKETSPNNTIGTREGQQLPFVKRLMWDHGDAWNPDRRYDWGLIKKEWFKYWDTTKSVLVEKSPSNLVRVSAINQHFHPTRYICLIRNPYAVGESIIRRKIYSPTQAAEFIVRGLHLHEQWLKSLNHVLLLSYEKLTDNPEDAKSQLVGFLPALADIDHSGIFKAHNMLVKKLPIVNLNKQKISQLTDQQLLEINNVFMTYSSLINHFGYSVFQSKDELLHSV